MRGFCLASVLLAAGTAHPYIDTLVCPLDQFNGTFRVIAEGTIEKVDAGKKVCVIKVGKALKGKPEYTHIRVNIGAGHEWHPEVVMPHLVQGAPVLLWYYWGEGPKAAIYVNRFFLEAYRTQEDGDRVWWHFTSVATLYNRTYNGTVEELGALLPGVLAGRTKGPVPDPKLPTITRENLSALPVWGRPADPRKLPLAFRPRRSALTDKLREPDRHGPLTPGVAFRAYEGTWEALPDAEKLKPARSGTCGTIGLAPRARDAGYAIRFSGFLDVPRDGVYTFILVSNDGSSLSIGGIEVIDNDHYKSVVEAGGDIALKAGKHAFTVRYFQHSGFQVLEAWWSGPDLPRQQIPATAFFREESR